jgi:hypothetical protein
MPENTDLYFAANSRDNMGIISLQGQIFRAEGDKISSGYENFGIQNAPTHQFTEKDGVYVAIFALRNGSYVDNPRPYELMNSGFEIFFHQTIPSPPQVIGYSVFITKEPLKARNYAGKYLRAGGTFTPFLEELVQKHTDKLSNPWPDIACKR